MPHNADRPRRLGILPAAGKADRWGGYPKELLPISNDHTFLSRSVNLLRSSGCDHVLVVTNPAKIHLHAYHLKDWKNVLFAIQQGQEMWGAMATAIDTPAQEYCFMMPDTYVSAPAFPDSLVGEFGLGLFLTDEPERFGVLRQGRVVNKQPAHTPAKAWGVLAWSDRVAAHWRENSYADYTAAINDAITCFDYGLWDLDYYFDIGSMKHYAEFLLSNPGEAQSVVLESDLLQPVSARRGAG
jgi:hypothetical protein